MNVNFMRISLVVVGFLVDLSDGGECCKAYYDLTSDYHKMKWCDDYCCGSSILGVLDCCDVKLLIAPKDDRVAFCADYFIQNIWAPILIGLGGLGMFICCIVCCVACFGGNKKRGTVVNQMPQQPATSVFMMTPGGQNPQPLAGQGYGQCPPQYQLVPGPGVSGPGFHNTVAPTPGIPAAGPVAGNSIEPETESKHPFASTE